MKTLKSAHKKNATHEICFIKNKFIEYEKKIFLYNSFVDNSINKTFHAIVYTQDSKPIFLSGWRQTGAWGALLANVVLASRIVLIIHFNKENDHSKSKSESEIVVGSG